MQGKTQAKENSSAGRVVPETKLSIRKFLFDVSVVVVISTLGAFVVNIVVLYLKPFIESHFVWGMVLSALLVSWVFLSAASSLFAIWYSDKPPNLWFQKQPVQVRLHSKDRVELIRDQLKVTGRLLDELQDELSVRTRLLEQRQAEAQHYERLASLNAEQAGEIEKMIRRVSARPSPASWVQMIISLTIGTCLGFFVNLLTLTPR